MKVCVSGRSAGFLAGVVGVLAVAGGAYGENVTYTVDAARSSRTLSGTYGGNEVRSRIGFPYSLVSTYAGTISAERDPSAGTLSITGATIAAQAKGTAGAMPGQSGDYGFVASGNGRGVDATWGNLAFSLAGTVPTSGAGTGSSFGTGGLSGSVVSGLLNCEGFEAPCLQLGFIIPDVQGNLYIGAETGEVTDFRGVETLTIPFDGTFTFGAFDATLSGWIVATAPISGAGAWASPAPVPEPGTLALLALPVVGMLGRRRRG